MAGDTAWDYWGAKLEWLTRDGSVKHLHGNNFYARTNVPPTYDDAQRNQNPIVTAELPPVDDFKAHFTVGHGFMTFYLHWTEEFTSDDFTGLSVFQINPRAAGRTWELKHTRIGHGYSPLTVIGAAWADYPIDLQWPCPRLIDARIFARLYHYTAFANYGPMTCTPY